MVEDGGCGVVRCEAETECPFAPLGGAPMAFDI